MAQYKSSIFVTANSKKYSFVKNKDDVKVYIRHCEERTVPVLQWFFRDFDVELICGLDRRFADVLEDLFLAIENQKQEFALILDGDLVPVISADDIVHLFVEPFLQFKKLITLNGNMVWKFFSLDRAAIGGIKSYRKQRIELYLKNLDKSRERPESYLYSKVGYSGQIKTNRPQAGHEYGQFLWHLHEKALQRGAKASWEVPMREGDDIDFVVYKRAYEMGKALKEGHVPESYNKNSIPQEYLRKEKESISSDNVENEYFKMKEEINNDIRHDMGNILDEPIFVRDIQVRNSLILTKIIEKLGMTLHKNHKIAK